MDNGDLGAGVARFVLDGRSISADPNGTPDERLRFSADATVATGVVENRRVLMCITASPGCLRSGQHGACEDLVPGMLSMKTTKTEQELINMFSHSMNIAVSSVELDLIQEGILDSLTLVDLLFNIENSFNVQISIEDLDADKLRTIRKIGEYVDEKSSSRSGS